MSNFKTKLKMLFQSSFMLNNFTKQKTNKCSSKKCFFENCAQCIAYHAVQKNTCSETHCICSNLKTNTFSLNDLKCNKIFNTWIKTPYLSVTSLSPLSSSSSSYQPPVYSTALHNVNTCQRSFCADCDYGKNITYLNSTFGNTCTKINNIVENKVLENKTHKSSFLTDSTQNSKSKNDNKILNQQSMSMNSCANNLSNFDLKTNKKRLKYLPICLGLNSINLSNKSTLSTSDLLLKNLPDTLFNK